MKTLILLVLTMLNSAGFCLAENINIYPDKPKGGEGVLVSAPGSCGGEYSVVQGNKQYFLYDLDNGLAGVFLPVWIEEKDPEKIAIFKRVPEGFMAESDITIEIEERPLEIVYLRKTDEKMRSAQPMIEAQNKTVSKKLHYASREKLWEGPFIAPIKARITSPFALKREGKKYSYFHRGIDYGAPAGSAIRAINNGKVILAAKKLNVYGNSIIIDHGQGIVSCYFHMHKIYRNEGEKIKKGEIIGEVGSTGWATGPHLHFGIYLQGVPVDPLWFIRFTEDIYNKQGQTKRR